MSDPVDALGDFLRARIAEDEADAERAVIEAHEGHRPNPELAEWEYAQLHQQWRIQVVGSDPSWPLTVTHDSEGLSDSVADWAGPHIARWDPARVRRECAAKRRIVDCAHRMILDADDPESVMSVKERFFATSCAMTILKAEAVPYAGHPDCRQEWTVG